MPNDKIVIIPTYNEADTIVKLVPEIFKIYPETDILVVDDNSPDGTGKAVDELAKADSRTRCLHRPRKEGIGPAYIEAIGMALKSPYNFILHMDADFSHDPKYIPAIFEAAEDCDLVLGSRYIKGGGIANWPLSRKILSRLGNLYAKTILGVPINDLTGGFKCFRREVLEAINLDTVTSRGYAFLIETTFRAYRRGFRIKEVPIVFSDRRFGKTKMSRCIFLEAVINVWKFRYAKKF